MDRLKSCVAFATCASAGKLKFNSIFELVMVVASALELIKWQSRFIEWP